MIKLRRILLYDNIYRMSFLFALSFSLLITLIPNYTSVYKGDETNFNCKVLDKKFDGNKLSLSLKCKENIVSTYYIKSEKELSYLKDNIKFDSRVTLTGSLITPKESTIPNGFNYKKYLYNKSVYYILKVNKIESITKTKNIFYKLKNFMYDRSDKIDNSTYIYSFVLGKTQLIDIDVLNTYRTNGVSHLFALSGQHVSVFSLILLWILKKLKIKELPRYIIIFIFLLLFSFITGFSPSILRSTLLFFLLGINKVFYFNIKTINILYIVFIILVLINPFVIYNLSFILSFTAAFFLIIGSDLVKGKNYFTSLFKVSLLASLSTMMVSIYYFGYTNPLAPLYNMFFVPFVSMIVFPLSLLVFIFPFLSLVLNFMTNIMESVSILFSKLNLIIYFPKVSLIIVFIFELLIILYIKFKKKTLLFILALILIIIKVKPYIVTGASIYYLDVGQGDSSLIVTKNLKETILIDTGGEVTYEKESWQKQKKIYSIAENSLIPFFRSIGINKIKYLILTHGDFDHMGEGVNLINNFKVENVILNCGEFNTLEINLLKLLKEKNIKYYSCINNIKTSDFTLNFLNTKKYNNENDNSSVIYFDYNNYKFLFMADASKKVEENILNKYYLDKVDFLKVGHHGSNTSTSEKFVSKISPKYSVISVGKNNRYGHPKIEVLNSLKSSNIYRTDIDGSIEIKLNKKGYDITTYSP